jgi:hypothetical protein
MSVGISDEVAALVESGTAAWLATCDRERRPSAVRVMGARFNDTRDRLTLYVPIEQAGHTFDNLAHGSQLAICFVRITDYKAVQLKGSLIDVRLATEREQAEQQRYMRDFIDAIVSVGLPRTVWERMTFWPSKRVEIRIASSFVQTPGTRAGEAL